MIRSGEKKRLRDFRACPVKLPVRFPAITATESPEKVSHLQGNWRFENSGIYLHTNKDKGVTRNRLMDAKAIKKVLLTLINFLLAIRIDSSKKAISDTAMPCTIG